MRHAAGEAHGLVSAIFADVYAHHPGARLLLVGSGPETPKLQSLSIELQVENRTFFVPGQAQVADWLRNMDVYVNASVSESFQMLYWRRWLAVAVRSVPTLEEYQNWSRMGKAE